MLHNPGILCYTKDMRYLVADELKQTILKLYMDKKSLSEIVDLLGYKRSVVTRILREQGALIRRRGKIQKYFLVNGEKECARCHKVKASTEFSLHSKTHDGLQSSCRECQNNGHRNYLLQRKFGITEDEYTRRWNTQGGVCAICGQPETRTKFGKITRLAVDHNHKTGVVRELICFRCNVVIGRLEESTKLCDAVKSYLLKYSIGGNR